MNPGARPRTCRIRRMAVLGPLAVSLVYRYHDAGTLPVTVVTRPITGQRTMQRPSLHTDLDVHTLPRECQKRVISFRNNVHFSSEYFRYLTVSSVSLIVCSFLSFISISLPTSLPFFSLFLLSVLPFLFLFLAVYPFSFLLSSKSRANR